VFTTARYQFDATRGGTFDPQLSLTQNGRPFSLEGWTVKVIVGNVTLTSIAGLTVDAAAGTVKMLLTPAQTAAFTADTERWYLQLTDPDGKVGFPLAGTIRFADP
jgi:hypothetical protein